MNILLFTDLRFTASERPTGVGKHIVQMARGLAAAPGFQLELLAAKDQMDARGKLPPSNALAGFSARAVPIGWKQAEALWTVCGRPFADAWAEGADWVYCPKNDFIPVRSTRVAVTVHGAAELDPFMPKTGGAGATLNRWRRRTAYLRMTRQAAAVLTVSEFLKGQVVDWFGVDPGKVHVVGNGVEEEYFAAAGRPPGGSGEATDRPFVLGVGGLNDLDGGDRLLEVAERLQRVRPEVRVLVAGTQHRADLRARARACGNIELLGYVPAPRLAALMRDSVALLFPTRYETFGIAAAEAMAAGTPVVTCGGTAVPEIVGDAGICYDPDAPGEGVEALCALLDDESLRAEWVAKGALKARAYTWQGCVERLRKVLDT